MNTDVLNNASKTYSTNSLHGEVYKKRIDSQRTALAVTTLLGDLPAAKTPTMHDGTYSVSTTSSRRLVKKKRLDVKIFSIKGVVEKAKKKGWLQSVDALNETHELINQVKSVEDPHEWSYKQAEDVERYLDKLDGNANIKETYGICCTKNRAIKPRPVGCKASGCINLIEIGAPCWETSLGDASKEKVIICTSCNTAKSSNPNVTVKAKMFLDSEHLSNEWVFIDKPKKDFKRTTLKACDETEASVKCVFCDCKHHTQCVMYEHYNWKKAFEKYCKGFSNYFRNIYVCQKCMHIMLEDSSREKFPTFQFHPEDIKTTRLSEKIETWVRAYLKSKRTYNSMDKIFVREVSTKNFVFEAKPRMKSEYQKNNQSYTWDVRQRSIMLFQQNRNWDYPICLFNLIVHEYPANSAVNLSYIDSVKLFEPADLRRETFQEVILAYMEDARRRGYRNLYFWVCPPQTGDEYVFYGRPEECHPPCVQGGNSGIIGWYKEILKKAEAQHTISSYTQTNGVESPYKSHLDIPYLLDDFWPPKLETILDAHQKDNYENSVKLTTRASTRTTKNKKASSKSNAVTPITIETRIKEVIRAECRDTLFTVIFAPIEHAVRDDDEDDIFCSYTSNRDNFISDCRENKFDFSTVRRAQYSTLILCSRMAKESLTKKCSQCEKLIKKGFYCYNCPEDFTLCSKCMESVHSHPHQTFRSFQVPFVDKKIQPHPVFSKILKQLLKEADYLAGLSPYLSAGNTNNLRSGSLLKYKAEGVKEHQTLLYHYLHEEKQTFCRACIATWLPLLRHKEFCKGVACHVPSCTSNIVFDNQGAILRPTARRIPSGSYFKQYPWLIM